MKFKIIENNRFQKLENLEQVIGKGDDVTCGVNKQYQNCTGGVDPVYTSCQVTSHSEPHFFSGHCGGPTINPTQYTVCKGMTYDTCSIAEGHMTCPDYENKQG